MKQFLTIPTQLTLIRLLLIVPLLILINWQVPRFYLVALILLWCAWLTDVLDGYIARKYDMITPLGTVLDAMIDKLLMYCMLFSFFGLGVYRVWIIFPLFIRDMLTDTVRNYFSNTGDIQPANIWGKTKFGFQFASINSSMLFLMLGTENGMFFQVLANILLGLGFAAGIPGIIKLARAMYSRIW
jgi:CDP-diacylglycerol--glycerol-3-phosphate 3-phosphatidyltransferase